MEGLVHFVELRVEFGTSTRGFCTLRLETTHGRNKTLRCGSIGRFFCFRRLGDILVNGPRTLHECWNGLARLDLAFGTLRCMPQRRKHVVHFTHRTRHFRMFMFTVFAVFTVLVVTVCAFGGRRRTATTSHEKRANANGDKR